MAEALENDRNLPQPLLAGVHPGQQLFQLGDDAALFVEGWDDKWNFDKVLLIDRDLIYGMSNTMTNFFPKVLGLHVEISESRVYLAMPHSNS